MLHQETVEPATLELLNRLFSKDYLSGFALAGGTALALQLGHRISIDLDFFSDHPFNANELTKQISSDFRLDKEFIEIEENTLNCIINNIRVQFLTYNYQQVRPDLNDGAIRLYSLPDGAAMKLNAVTNRGAKKDFFDIAALLEVFSLKDMLNFYTKKYNVVNYQHVLKSLSYFEDAESEMNPVCLKKQNWTTVKKKVSTSVRLYFNEILNSKV